MAQRLEIFAVPGIPLVVPGDDLISLIETGLKSINQSLQNQDIVVIAQKIVSKSEGRIVELSSVEPSPKALELAKQSEKDPRLVELILSESKEIIRYRPGLIITAHKLGYILANAGIDVSNVAPENDGEQVLLLPVNPDQSCTVLRSQIRAYYNKDVAVIINDSVGRAWRVGTVGIALGADGLESVLDLRGKEDLFGRPLAVSIVGIGDEMAAAASILQGQGNEGLPVVIIRGFVGEKTVMRGSDLVRDKEEDLFR